jgi:hypothetical protein
MRKQLFTISFLVCLISGCALFKSTARTANDAGLILCQLFAAEHKEEVGMSPGDWCAIHRNLQPFIEEALSAKQKAGAFATKNPNAGE